MEKLKAETERSLEVVKEKLAHGLIESVTKQRKLSSIFSLLARIETYRKRTLGLLETLIPSGKEDLSLSSVEIKLVRATMREYESIREDFKEVMEMSDERLEKLFPKVATYFENRFQAGTILINMRWQIEQMLAYSLRMIV